MSYEAAFALHLIAVILFAGTLLLSGAAIPSLAPGSAEARRLRLLNLWVASPALVAVWAFGGTMAIEAGWWMTGWLKAKLVLVLLLSAMHGRQLRALRRIAAGRPAGVGLGGLAVSAGAVLGAALLAGSKAF